MARLPSQLWAWLPAFRAAAETEHLPSAAQQLSVTVPAVSRTLRVLEEQLERRLFARDGRRLRLNESGEVLLAAVRDAMRRIDDGIASLSELNERGPAVIAADGPITFAYATPAALAVRERYPEIEPVFRSVSGPAALEGLLNGQIDVVLATERHSHADVIASRVATVRYNVCCGPGHPLYRARSISPDRLAEYPFVTPLEPSLDGWPADLPRRVAARVEVFSTALQLCASGAFLALLPDTLIQSHGLRGLTDGLCPSEPLYLYQRRPMSESARPRRVAETMREFLSDQNGMKD